MSFVSFDIPTIYPIPYNANEKPCGWLVAIVVVLCALVYKISEIFTLISNYIYSIPLVFVVFSPFGISVSVTQCHVTVKHTGMKHKIKSL